MAMRSHIELYAHDNETNPGKKKLRLSVKSPLLTKKGGRSNLNERTKTQGRI